MWKLNIDTGGTFTDCLGHSPTGEIKRIKVLSSSRLKGRILEKVGPNTFKFDAPWQYPSPVLEGYFLQIGEVIGRLTSINYDQKLFISDTDFALSESSDFQLFGNEEAPVLAARLLTQTPLHEPLPSIEMRLGTTRGTNALLERKGAKTVLFVTKGFKDLLYIGNQQRPSLFQLDIPEPNLLYSEVVEIDERMDAKGMILEHLQQPNLDVVSNAESVAISLMHSYLNDTHEKALSASIRQAGVNYISASSELFPFSHYVRRTQTAVVNAYLDPILDQYLSNIKNSLATGSLKVMTSTGSLSEISSFRAKDSLLSGPAGGMVAATNKGRQFGIDKVLTFDMGGTSTDVARIDGQPELKYITEIDGIEFHNPTMDIETVAAGGGSVCWFDGFSLQVGPESAGASPGPACYGAGGPLTITDVNLLLGKLDPAQFSIPIHTKDALLALEKLRNEIKELNNNLLSHYEILKGLERIANEKMADAIRKISVEKGISPSEYALITFGGAGGLHSCQLADLLDIKNVIIPYDAGLFSAVGIGEALSSTIVSKQILLPWTIAEPRIEEWKNELLTQAEKALAKQKIKESEVVFFDVFLRFVGQENTINLSWEGPQTLENFRLNYTAQYGHFPKEIPIELESVKLKIQEKSEKITPSLQVGTGTPATPIGQNQAPFTDLENSDSIDVFEWDRLHAGNKINGPAILLNKTSTVFIPENWQIIIQPNRDASAFHFLENISMASAEKEEVAIQLFTNRFEAIAEEMGAQLQRTAFSVNVKERLDFSCALLDPDGDLLVNAQHIPVHLGSMGICGRLVLEYIEVGPGDVIITNHPKYGGSHLPDVTLLSGVFTKDSECVGYVINRAHHAEIGGKTPGSMPPDAVCLAEEGVVIPPQYLVKKGEFQWDTIRRLFTECAYPTRNFQSNEADIMAALSALRKGTDQLLKLTKVHGVEVIKKYMHLLKTSASIRLQTTLLDQHGKTFEATELLDDNHRIQVKISISPAQQIFDFAGTSSVHPNNLNANISILHSAILYVLRLWMNRKIPLNDGLMEQVKIILPENSFLHPHFSDDPLLCPAVVGGNTEVSQRLVDTLLKALGLAACSQGTMNNFLFGNDQFGYYETIGGGVGAGKGFHGRSAVHQHMTNTRITDPEPLELKYPVRLHKFGIRKGSGGNGQFKGGDGIIRKVEFLKPLQLTLLGQHRVQEPYGIEGGENGKCGKHTLESHGVLTVLAGIVSLPLKKGDILTIETPGGGGYGQVV